MESCSQLYIRKIIDSILNNIKQRHNNILFVKYYNTLNLQESELREVFETQDDDICFYIMNFLQNICTVFLSLSSTGLWSSIRNFIVMSQ